MPLYGGIDLHSTNSVVVLMNEQDEVIYQKRLPNDLPTILGQLAPHHAAIEGLVVESTYNWYWLVDGLMDADYRVHLANPAAIQQYSGLKYSDDHSDARWLGHLLRLGYCRKDTSILKPTGRCGICYANARTSFVSTPPMLVSKISWCAIPVRVSVSSGFAS